MSEKNRRSKKVLLSVAALGVTASIAGLGTFAQFTSSTSASQAVSSGTVSINLGPAGTADNRLTIGATGLVPGDSLERRVKLSNPTGNEDLSAITLTTEDTTLSDTVLSTDATNGLKMTIEKCSVAWVESTSTPYTYTCAGTSTTVLARRAIIGTDLSLSSMSSVTAGQTDDLVVTVDLPSTADNTFQSKSADIQYTFTGTQRAATSK
ncbi:MAG TPA: TasA family protein [Acidimicrobiales bacterium]|nr:TasA family protein [Acidimicrobiales bacterium]